jgi:hypothetical protein
MCILRVKYDITSFSMRIIFLALHNHQTAARNGKTDGPSMLCRNQLYKLFSWKKAWSVNPNDFQKHLTNAQSLKHCSVVSSFVLHIGQKISWSIPRWHKIEFSSQYKIFCWWVFFFGEYSETWNSTLFKFIYFLFKKKTY